MELKPVESYRKPAYSSFRMKCGRVLPAGLAIASALTLLGGCDEVERTQGIPPLPDTETEIVAIDGDIAVPEVEFLLGESFVSLLPEDDLPCPTEEDLDVELLNGDIAYVEVEDN